MATTAKTSLAPAPHRLRVEGPGGDAEILRGRHRPAAAWRPGASRTCCSAPSAPTATASSAWATAVRWRSSSSRSRGPGAVRAADAGLAVPSHRAQRRQADAGRHRAAAARPPATRSRRPSCSSTATAARSTSRIPNGMIVEFTLDHPDVEKINATRRQGACRAQALAGGRPHLQQHVSR